MSYGYIYKIVNLINDNIYVGQTTSTIGHRFSQHKYCAKNNQSKCRYLNNALNKYGHENFKIVSLFRANNQDELNHREILAMSLLKPKYNIREGGGSKGKMSEESKKRLSLARTGKKLSPEHIKKLSQSKLGKSNLNKRIPISVIDLFSGIVLHFASINEAASYCKTKRNNISAAKHGKQKTFSYGRYMPIEV